MDRSAERAKDQPAGTRPRLMTILLCAAPAILLAVAVLVPFRDKAFTIDDTVFLSEAEHALSDPWHPTAFEAMYRNEVYGMYGIVAILALVLRLLPLGGLVIHGSSQVVDRPVSQPASQQRP